MIQITRTYSIRWVVALALSMCVTVLFTAATARSQIFSLTREELIEITAQNPFDRFPDGRPKIPDELIERARDLDLESEDIRVGGGMISEVNLLTDSVYCFPARRCLAGLSLYSSCRRVRTSRISQGKRQKPGASYAEESICCNPAI